MTIDQYPKPSADCMDNIKNYLKDTMISDVMAHKRRFLGFRALISVSQDEPIVNVLKLMKDHDIVTVPVYTGGDQRRFLFLCTVDMILEWIVFQEAFKDCGKNKLLKTEGDWLKSFRTFMAHEDREFTIKVPVRDVLNVYPTQAKFLPLVTPEDSAAHLLSLFITAPQRLQRVLVVEDKSKVVQLNREHPNQMILSITDLVSFLDDEQKKPRSHDLKAIFGQNIIAANMLFNRFQHRSANQPFSPTLITCPLNMPSMDVFRMLFMEDVSAMAIVDSRDKLCGTISASDLVGLSKDNIELLNSSLATFMEHVKSSPSQLKKNMLGACTTELTVATAVRRMLKHKVHRVWLMNDDSVPLGCVSFADVLTLLYSDGLED